MGDTVLHRILEMFSGQSATERQFMQTWNGRVKSQHDALPKSGFHPVAEEALAISDAKYADQSYRSMMFDGGNRAYQRLVLPVRALCNWRNSDSDGRSPYMPHPCD